MIAFIDLSGKITTVIDEPVYLGSNISGSVYVVAPFPVDNGISVAFTLPNGVITTKYPMFLSKQTVIPALPENYNVWEYSISNAITSYAGTVAVQFYITHNVATGTIPIISTASTTFTVAKGVPQIPISPTSEEAWNLMLQYCQDANTTANNALDVANSTLAIVNTKQNIDIPNSQTTAKTVEGAINELSNRKVNVKEEDASYSTSIYRPTSSSIRLVVNSKPITPLESSITLWDTDVKIKATSATLNDSNILTELDKGVPNGIASLDQTGKVPIEQLPDQEIDLDVVTENQTSSSNIILPNTPQSSIEPNDYNVILDHNRLYNGEQVPEEWVGKNLLPYNGAVNITSSTNNVVATSLGNGAYQIVCTGSGTVNWNVTESMLKSANTNYLKIRNNVANSDVELGILTTDGDIIKTTLGATDTVFSLSIPSDKTILGLTFNSLLATNNLTVIIQPSIELNNVADSFVEFIPQPTPTNPLPIIPTGNTSQVVSGGVNLRSNTITSYQTTASFTNEVLEIKSSIAEPSSSKFAGFVNINLEANTKYFVKCKIDGIAHFKECVVFNKVESDFLTVSSNTEFSFTTKNYDTTTARLYFYLADDTPLGVGINVENIIISKVDVPYQPYLTPITTTFNYTAIDPSKQSLIDDAITIGDYASEVYTKNGKSYVMVKTGKVVFNGSENWGIFTNFPNINTNGFSLGFSMGGSQYQSPNVCDKLPTIGGTSFTTADEQSIACRPTLTLIKINKSYNITTETEFKTWLATNNITLYYPLATAVEVEIQPITQKLPTFSGGTTLTTQNIALTNAKPLLDFTNYIASNLPKVYALAKDKNGRLLLIYNESTMIKDPNSGMYLVDLLKAPMLQSPDGSWWRETINNSGVISWTKVV